MGLYEIVSLVVQLLGLIVPLLVGVAYFTLAERKILSSIQRRRGPNVVGIYGLTQALADGLKLFLKERVLPTRANPLLFRLAPVARFTLALLFWGVLPIREGMVFRDVNLGIMYLFAVSSLAVYGVLIAGWRSNRVYAFFGALRSTAQMVSYEVSFGFLLVNVLLCVGRLNLRAIVEWQRTIWLCIPLLPVCLMFLVSILAETNRHPFDLPEAEAELVSGYNVEYSGMGFALFFLAEYGNMIGMRVLTSILFFGGWLPPLAIAPFTWVPGAVWMGFKALFFVCFFIWARAAYPRYRYDQLMRLGWKRFLPASLGCVLFTAGILMGFDGLPR